MSTTLRVTLDGHRLSSTEKGDVEALYRSAAKAALPPSTVSSVRLVFRDEVQGTTIEPFLGSASFEALLGIAKKRDDTMALLGVLVASAFLFSENVGVLLADERQPVPTGKTDLSLAALRARNRLTPAWYRIAASFTWFHFARVEAKLLQPLKVSGGKVATHYFRDVWVRAVDRQIACDAVSVLIARDAATVVAFGDVTLGEPPASSAGTGNLVTAGRVYFSAQAH